ncbi:MAG: 4-(cytidine 5'-diphospho)-2-C-methyl-D-erythritol kinase [Fibrobacter sp.]|nr:4-(cytidine 5'-diphospho)-2-C-methyl-D-erythritol kinase [Fibrobacter sp.]MDY6368304.1 4-(cytidine 5'-diphospho)-2-C-methyl-D-erythritol kinase [Fibrobacter sp.]MDY6389635.1 4-(cytidine 5'-diphospho)-2-C-methyl-D-erythritol kinase [Fibrobacter sp.]
MLQEFAPAKINLFLDILSKRPDGYHDLGTLFQTINAGDTLSGELDPSGKISLRYNAPQEYPVESDLVYKAALLVQKTYEVKLGVSFYLEKKMPLGAGLGGGSADAAAALRLLNKLWNLNVSPEDLEKLGAKLGADVPFLVQGGSAMAEGIGDKLSRIEPLKLPRGAALLVATPQCAVPTKAAYAGCVPSGDARWEIYKNSDFSDFKGGAYNKFEESVLPQFPLIAQMKRDFLDYGADFSLMSGSGASVFGVFPSKALAEEAVKKLGKTARYAVVTDFFAGF